MSTIIKNQKWNLLFSKQKSQTSQDKEKSQNIDSYYFIYDCNFNEISFINSAFNTLTGYAPETFTVEQLIEMIHPEDQPYFFESEERGLKFTNQLMFNEHFQYTLSYSYRIKTKEGNYIRIKQQCNALEVNNQGHLTKTLVIHQRVKNIVSNPHNDYKIFDKSRNIYLDNKNCYNLTKRELEILDLVHNGFNSIEIAEKLHTSKFTVDTHRKNILKKTNSKNFMELLRKMSFNG